MKQLMQRGKSFLLILLGVVILELILSNGQSMTIPKDGKKVLATDLTTDDEGLCVSEEITIQDTVKNVYVQLGKDGAAQAEITIILTDEGDKYAYSLPKKTVVREVSDTSFIWIYPFGKVQTISVEVSANEGEEIHVESIEINRRKSISFHFGRAVFIGLIVCFLYLGSARMACFQSACEKRNKKQWIICALSLFILAVIAWKLVHINPVFTNPPWPHHRQYQELAEVMAKGTVKLPYEPSEGLVQAANPYDTISLMAENIPYMMDYAYYNGAYYVYFGIVPEVLLYWPVYMLTGSHLMNWQVIYLFYLLFAVGVFGLIRELAYKFYEKVSFFHTLVMSFVVCLFPNFVYILCRPDIYHIPIMSGTAFLTCAVSLFLVGARQERNSVRNIDWTLAAFCGALVAGCRPQFLLYELLLVVLLVVEEKRKEDKERLLGTIIRKKDITAILLPYIFIAVFVFLYNYARFGSGFDFGATYSLTTNDMNHRGVSIVRMLQGLFGFLLQPANIQARFPFIMKAEVHYGFMGKDLSEYSFGGMITSAAFLWPVFILPYFINEERKKEDKKIIWVRICLLLSSLVIAAFDANSAGILQRYFADAVWGICLLACLLWMSVLADKKNFELVGKLFITASLLTLLYSFFLIFAKGDSNCLQAYNAQVYYKVMSWFSL